MAKIEYGVKPDIFKITHFFNNDMPNRLTEQKKLRVYNWNPRPRCGKKGSLEEQIAEKWRIVTLHEAIQYMDHEFLTTRFHVTHDGSCAILFNRNFFLPSHQGHVHLPSWPQALPAGQSDWRTN